MKVMKVSSDMDEAIIKVITESKNPNKKPLIPHQF